MRKSRRSTPTVSRCPHPPPPASHLQPAPTTAQLHAAFRLPPSFTCGAYTRVRKCLYARAYAARTDHQQKVCTHARTQRVRKFCTHARTRACGTLPALLVHQKSLAKSVRSSVCSSVVRSFVRSFIRSFVRSFVRQFVRSFVSSFVRSSVRSFVRQFVRSSVSSFVRSSVRSFVRSFVRSWILL